jgi:thiosulfate/3-mercaptopyruvate sulfurtransferase
MLPAPDKFAASMGALGIAQDDHVVIYDDSDFFSSSRVLWTFKALGHDKVSILDGGFKAAKEAGLVVEPGHHEYTAQVYATPTPNKAIVVDYDGVVYNNQLPASERAQVIDARPRER